MAIIGLSIDPERCDGFDNSIGATLYIFDLDGDERDVYGMGSMAPDRLQMVRTVARGDRVGMSSAVEGEAA